MRGGSPHSGRPPDPNALRRGRPADQATWTNLPKTGREGPPPKWPLEICGPREEVLWDEWWAMPQAIMWEHNAHYHDVALAVRAFVKAEDLRATAADQTIALRMLEGLGMTEPGLLRNRWRIVDDNAASAPVASGETATPRKKRGRDEIKARLRAIEGGGD